MRPLFLVGLLLITVDLTALAGPEVPSGGKEATSVDEFPFTFGHKEFEVGVGAFGSIGTKNTAERPDVGFVLGQARFGLMLSNPLGTGFLRGNVEGLFEGYGAGIFTGPGDQIYGAGFILRWNFVQPNAHLIPFLQIQGGGAYSDMAHDDEVQRLVGADWSFSFGGEVGLRWLFSPKFALTGGVEYRHISNADTSDRNRGLNALGGTIGISLFY